MAHSAGMQSLFMEKVIELRLFLFLCGTKLCRCEELSTYVSAAEQRVRLEAYEMGVLDIIAECGMLTEGYDNHLISVVAFFTPLK